MIHRFRIGNFQSIRQSVELDFRIPGTTPELPCFRRSSARPDVRLPNVIALVGPNGSGKTTVLRALMTVIRFVASAPSQDGLAGFLPFVSTDSWARETLVEIDFDISIPWYDLGESDTLCRYSLNLQRNEGTLAADRVSHEALYAFPKGRPRRILERNGSETVRVAQETGMRPGDDRLKSVPDKASAIAALSWMGVASFADIVGKISGVPTNILGSDPWKPDADAVTKFYKENPKYLETVSDRMRRFDIGIENMSVGDNNDGSPMLLFKHFGLDLNMPLHSESSGTRHMVLMFPLIHFALETGRLVIMDALDTDLHADLAIEVLEWFRRPDLNPHGALLICSLHNLALLDDLEKEEAFIVEKDQDGGTVAYGARDIPGLRRKAGLQKLYRSGALGGLPTIG